MQVFGRKVSDIAHSTSSKLQERHKIEMAEFDTSSAVFCLCERLTAAEVELTQVCVC